MRIRIKILDMLLIVAVSIVVVLTVFIKFKPDAMQDVIRPAHDTLVVAHFWQDDAVKQTLDTLAQEFQKQNPAVFIEFRDYSYADMQNILLSPLPEESADKKLKRFTASDVFIFDPRWLSEMISNNTLEPLTEYRQETEDASAGEWAVPLTASIELLFYNIDMLKAVGFERPPKNWAEFKRYAEVLSGPGHYGWTLSLSADGYPELYPWVWAAGAAMLEQSETGIRPAFHTPLIVNTLSFINTLNTEGVIAPNTAIKTKKQKFNEFTSGKAGMMIASVEDIEAVRQKMGSTSFGVTTIPHPDNFSGSRPIFGVRNAYAGIRTGSAYKSEAWAFISYLAGHSPCLAGAVHVLPGNGNTPMSLKDNAFYTKVCDMYESSDQMREFIGVPNVHILDAIVRDALAAMFENGQVPEETARTIQGRWEALLGTSQH